MALDKQALENELKEIFNNANKNSNIDIVAKRMANAIDAYVKTGKATGVDSRGDSHTLSLS